jgi:hypothetical protein
LAGVRQAGQQALGAGAQFDTGVWRAGDLLQAAEQPRQRRLLPLLGNQVLGDRQLILAAAEGTKRSDWSPCTRALSRLPTGSGRGLSMVRVAPAWRC